MNKRIDWIDVTKGIGVVCIIFGHISFYLERTLLQIFVYGFSVFIFFITSGINFSKKANQPFSKLLKSIVKNYIIPYCICAIVVTIFEGFIYKTADAHTTLLNFVTQVNFKSFWYVPVLIFSQIFLWLLYQIIKNDKVRLVCIFFIYILFAILQNKYNYSFLWNIQYIPFGVFYLYIGTLIKDFVLSFNKKWYVNLMLATVLMIISCVSTYYNYFTNSSYEYISFTNIHIMPLSVLSAITGTLSVILIAKTIHNCKFFQYLGRNSFSFIAFNTGIVSYLMDDTIINSLFWNGSKILRTLLYIAMMVLFLSIIDVFYRAIYKNILKICGRINLYNCSN